MTQRFEQSLFTSTSDKSPMVTGILILFCFEKNVINSGFSRNFQAVWNEGGASVIYDFIILHNVQIFYTNF